MKGLNPGVISYYTKKKRSKTYRKDLDGAGLLDDLLSSGLFGSPYHVDYKNGIELLKDPDLFKTPNKQEIAYMKEKLNTTKSNTRKLKLMVTTGLIQVMLKKNGLGKKTIIYISRI